MADTILLKIVLPEDRSKTVKLNKDDTIADAIQKVHVQAHIPVVAGQNYALFFPKSSDPCDSAARLRDLGLDQLDTLDFKLFAGQTNDTPISPRNRAPPTRPAPASPALNRNAHTNLTASANAVLVFPPAPSAATTQGSGAVSPNAFGSRSASFRSSAPTRPAPQAPSPKLPAATPVSTGAAEAPASSGWNRPVPASASPKQTSATMRPRRMAPMNSDVPSFSPSSPTTTTTTTTPTTSTTTPTATPTDTKEPGATSTEPSSNISPRARPQFKFRAAPPPPLSSDTAADPPATGGWKSASTRAPSSKAGELQSDSKLARMLASSSPAPPPPTTKPESPILSPKPAAAISMGTGASMRVASADALTVVIECSDAQFKKTMRVSKTATLDETLRGLVAKKFLMEVDGYDVFVEPPSTEESKSKKPDERRRVDKASVMGNLNLVSLSRICLERVRMTIYIELHTGKIVSLIEHPTTQVKELHKHVFTLLAQRSQTPVESSSDYCVFVPHKPGTTTGGYLLDYSKPLSTYQFSPETILQLRLYREIPQNIIDNEGADIVHLTIESKNPPAIYATAVARNTSVGDVVSQFVRQSQLTNVMGHALHYTPPRRKDAEEVMLEPLMPLSFYNVKNTSKLIFRERTDPMAKLRAYVKPKDPDEKIFGVDPTTIEFVEDAGFQVPWHLVALKRVLVEQNAFEGTGIFRLAGDELEIHKVKKDLNSRTFQTCQDVNVASSLIKRWFGELPVRVFATIPARDFEACTTNPQLCATFPDKFAEPQRTMFLWLVDLLMEVVMREPLNKMGPGNVSVVVAPVLAHVPDNNPIASLVVTGQTVAILEKYLVYRRLLIQQRQ